MCAAAAATIGQRDTGARARAAAPGAVPVVVDTTLEPHRTNNRAITD